ncbi:MAG TPA: YdeI/OmpD-associated family protein [Ignavibacteria bacterium]|nr:YdeI/OmpD-associated family protein [Ignavibacteria bacterium]HMR41036.1 YdeI/OmpD-associated family protein [Ignavibacteria bacterium]
MPTKIISGVTDERIDAYIKSREEFAKPILNHIRRLVHKACPETEETIKWSFPHFDYKGEMLCSMAAFKQHCAFTFWKASLMKMNKALELTERSAMGHLGKIKSLGDLPPDGEIISMIREAMDLNDKGIKLKKANVTQKSVSKEISVPGYFSKVLNKNKKAKDTFIAFSPSHKREYMEWIEGAKTEATRDRRISQAIGLLSEGKTRNWKYIKK